MKIAADIIWSDGQIFRNRSLAFEEGKVTRISDQDNATLTLPNHAIIPGFANAHSHSFQRSIRGESEWSQIGAIDDFWSWRKAMYGAVSRLTPEIIESIAEWTFLEMLKAGVTAVGEFHYVHHQVGGQPYENIAELSERVIAAAQRVGIRLTHLPVAYARGGYNRTLTSEQRRFTFSECEQFLNLVDDLQHRYGDHETTTIGLAPHSVRAVDRQWLEECGAFAHSSKAPLHIHVCEQIRELEECQAEYGQSPIEVLAALSMLHHRTTLVHATHLSKADVVHIGKSGSVVCACPTTEANLGDGFVPASALLKAGVRLCLGTDSHAQIDLFQEGRLVEIQQRLQVRKRNVLASLNPQTDTIQRTSDAIWPMMNKHGYQSLGLSGGDLSPGSPADFVIIDLNHPSLLGVSAEYLLDTLILSGQNDAVRSVYVNGQRVLTDGMSAEELRIRSAYIGALNTLRA